MNITKIILEHTTQSKRFTKIYSNIKKLDTSNMTIEVSKEEYIKLKHNLVIDINYDSICVLVSGGLDSYIAYHLAKKLVKKVIPLYVNLGHDYYNNEFSSLNNLGITPIYFDCRIMDIMKSPEEADWIIPGRNLLLSTLGSMLSSNVWLSALETEMHKFAKERDKSHKFYNDTNDLLDFVMNVKQSSTNLCSPFETLSKSEIINLALNHLKIPFTFLMQTSSCYSGNSYTSCGVCLTCFKRWIALSNSNIHEDYENKPYLSEYALRTTEEMLEAYNKNDFSHYTEKRCIETFLAFDKLTFNL